MRINCTFKAGTALGVNDSTLADHFMLDNPDSFKHSPAFGWHRWDGKVWGRLESDLEVRETVRTYVVRALKQAAADRETEGGVIAALTSYRNATRITGVVKTLSHHGDVLVASDAFDPDPDLLNTQSGVVDLRTGVKTEWDPALMMSRITKYGYDPMAKHDDWTAALRALPNEETRRWFNRLVGSGCTGHRPTDDVSGIANGGGDNGKTTLLGSVFEALGSYAVAVPDSALTNHAATSDSIQFLGARFALLDETSEGARLNVQMLKKLSNDVMKGRELYKSYVEFRPTHTLLVSTNHKPIVQDTTWGAWKRLALIPFTVKFGADTEGGDKAVDTDLKPRLIAGEAGRGEAILAWLVGGARRWYEDKSLRPLPPEVEAARDTWRGETDVIFRFASDELEFGPGFQTKKSDMWVAHLAWADANGMQNALKSSTALSRQFQAHQVAVQAKVVDTKLTGGVRSWVGVRLVPGGTGAQAVERHEAAEAMGEGR